MPRRSAAAPSPPPSETPPILRPLAFRDRHRTSLESDCLVEILSQLYNHRSEGVLTISADDTVRSLWIRDGRVVFATSSHRGDSLWAFLLRERIMPLDLLREVAFERANTTRPYGALLLERGLISPRRLHEAIKQQLEQVARALFEMSSGAVELVIGPARQYHSIHIDLPLPRLILDGCRHGEGVRRWPERLGGVSSVLLADVTPERLIDLAIDVDELALAKLADGTRTVAEICAEGPHEPDENGRIVYSLACLGLLKPASSD